MIKYFFLTLISGLCLQYTPEANAAVMDSVGTVVRNGKNFTIHKVAPRETIYALARQYGVPVTQIQQANPGITTLAVGQTLYVPGRPAPSGTVAVTPAKPAVSAPVATATPAKTNLPAPAGEQPSQVHTVQNRQTLLAIARQYNVTMVDIRKWNNLTSDILKEGQVLIVGAASTPETTSAASGPITASVADVKTEPRAVTPVATPVPAAKPVIKKEEIKPAPVTTRETANEKVERTETKYTESLSRISESGLAEVMDQKSDGSKYLALHKTAPVGTILQVKNTQNNQSVYVRVSGKLPESSGNDKVIIRISKRAYQKLDAADNQFRVEVNYMP